MSQSTPPSSNPQPIRPAVDRIDDVGAQTRFRHTSAFISLQPIESPLHRSKPGAPGRIDKNSTIVVRCQILLCAVRCEDAVVKPLDSPGTTTPEIPVAIFKQRTDNFAFQIRGSVDVGNSVGIDPD